MTHSFRTIIDIEPHLEQINHDSPSLLIGSCFAENMAKKLNYFGFPINFNPFGIIYNAHSIGKCLNYIASSQTIEEKDLIFHNGLWHSKWHHGSFSDPEKVKTLRNCNIPLKQSQQALAEINTVIISLGTAIVYQLKSTGEYVGNCHKIPQDQFTKSSMGVEEIVRTLKDSINNVLKINPKLNFILTVSPIRHLRDGFIESTQSKASLILAAHQLKKHFDQVYYFPAYEIMMDDLRDYRFYTEDMLHPNQQAIDYIWSKFKAACISNSAEELSLKVDSLRRAMAHEPLHPGSEKHLEFLEKLKIKIELFKEQNPKIKLNDLPFGK